MYVTATASCTVIEDKPARSFVHEMIPDDGDRYVAEN